MSDDDRTALSNLRYDIPLFVDGEEREARSSAWFDATHPATHEITGRVARAMAADVDDAVRAARAALSGPWGTMPPSHRFALLEAVADGIEARFEAFLAAEVADTGKPISFARAVDIPRGAANFRAFANLARAANDEAFHTETPDGRGAINYTVRGPIGVVGVICPWNLPLLLLTWKIAPALAAGNTVVVKPSEETPRTASLLAEVMRDVGVPRGVYNVVHGFGPGEAGEAIVTHPGVGAITFTGESATGATIMAAAAPHLTPLSFELGGKNAAIVFPDVDIDEAASGVARSTFSNCGQVCLCSERVYVHRDIFDRFCQALVEKANAMRIGDPFDDATQMGSLISQQHRAKVLGAFDDARRDGGTILTGGEVPDLPAPFGSGAYVQPTVIAGLSESSDFVRREVFGPACHIAPFDDEAHALALANDSEYGLCAALWTQDIRRAHRVAAKLDVGLVWVNTWFLRDLRTPFGGVGRSGIGREGGRHSLDFYTETRNICVKL